MSDKTPSHSSYVTPTTRKTLSLSPEALDALALPLVGGEDKDGPCIRNARGLRIAKHIGTVATSGAVDEEIAAFIADLVNAALTVSE
jgi:hypothetical protein